MKNRIFIDTNVMLDFLGEREPFYESAAKLMTLSDKRKIKIIASAISYTTVNYFLAKFESPEVAKTKLRKFKIISEICKIDEHTIEKSLNSSFKDFEDSVQYFSAIDSDCEIIITRNGKDFKNSRIPVMTPQEYLKSLPPR